MSVRLPPIYDVGILATSAQQRAACHERDKGICCACGAKNGPWYADHIHPLWLADRQNPEHLRYWRAGNLQTLCGPCHARKTKREAAARAKMKRQMDKFKIVKKPPTGKPRIKRDKTATLKGHGKRTFQR